MNQKIVCVLLIFGVGELFSSHPVAHSLFDIPVTDSLFVNIPVADSFDNIRVALAIPPCFDLISSQLLSPDTYNYFLSLPEKLASNYLNAR